MRPVRITERFQLANWPTGQRVAPWQDYRHRENRKNHSFALPRRESLQDLRARAGAKGRLALLIDSPGTWTASGNGQLIGLLRRLADATRPISHRQSSLAGPNPGPPPVP